MCDDPNYDNYNDDNHNNNDYYLYFILPVNSHDEVNHVTPSIPWNR